MKKILFISDPLASFNVVSDTTYALILKANQLGYEVHHCLPNNIFAQNNLVLANTKKLEILTTLEECPQGKNLWYNETNVYLNEPLTNYFAVFVRNDPPFNMEYYYLTQLMTLAENCGVNVINSGYALRNFNEKLSILNFPEFITPTLVSRDKTSILDFISLHGECVIKPLDLMAGRGVFKISPSEINLGVIIETSTQYYTQTVMVQKFIKEVIHGDHRVFIINGSVLPYCLHRIPQTNQIRGNLAAGGRAVANKITARDLEIGNVVAKWLMQHKVKFAGIDIIGDYLTEINITSPTAIRQIYNQTGYDIAKLIFDAL